LAETPPPPPQAFEYPPVTIEDEMRRSYLDYAMSVIVSRALPDVRDGLKPVHRRILFTMKEGNYDRQHPFRKSARIVGDVMGKYHPHGDSAIYDAMVRMAQGFSMRLPLVEGQGNFGSMDGDPPAAMRYTEARMAESAEYLLRDIEKETVDHKPSYDESGLEPTVLPAEFPNLLVNGAGGIAVGMATNIPPHNLGEVIDACCALIDDPSLDIDALMEYVPGPDFPTGAMILGKAGIRSAYHTGRGSVVIRARSHFETVRSEREAIVVTEVPYQLNKTRLLERIAEIVREKIVEGIADLRDESDRDGVRVVIELRRNANPDVVLAQLYRYSPLQTSFGVNSLALNGGRPETMNLKQIIEAFLRFREEVITRRTVFELNKARDRAHILVGLAVAVANLDAMIAVIRKSKDPAEARGKLTEKPWPAQDVAPLIERIDEPGDALKDDTYLLSDIQARAILDLRLHRLTALERGKIADELDELVARITEYLSILASREKLLKLLRDELLVVREKFADPRRTTLEDQEFDLDIEELIQREDMVVTVTQGGYVKRVPLSTYRAQKRGGKGRTGMATRDEDFVTQIFVVNTHTPVLFFSSRGMVYKMKVYRLPLGSPQARGKALVNLFPLEEGEVISTLMPLPEDEASWKNFFVIFATRTGNVRRNSLDDFVEVRANGKIAMKLDDGDALVSVQPCIDEQDVVLATRLGRCIRFAASEVRLFKGRNSVGVRGIRLAEGDEIISMSILNHGAFSTAERDAYFRRVRAGDAAEEENGADENGADENGADADGVEEIETANENFMLDDARFEAMAEGEEFVLTIASNGFGKRTSAYDYRITKRGGKGIELMRLRTEEAEVTAAFRVTPGDELVMTSDGGQIIRMSVDDIRVARRSTRGVTLFRVAEDERVVSVARLRDDEEEGQGEEDGETPEEMLEGETALVAENSEIGEAPEDEIASDPEPDESV
jgi:DNA gyrase subunit A